MAANRRSAPADDSDLGADFLAIKDAAAAWKARADSGLSRREEAELRVWLDADPRHRAALARFDLIWDKLDLPFSFGAADALMRELDIRARRRRRRVISAVAGAALLVAAGLSWRLAIPRSGIGPAVATVPGASAVDTVLLLPERRTLPDGSVVELKRGAEIAVAFTSEIRRVVLRRGEAHFQVAKDASHPFVVVAAGVEARAVGTAFTVELRPTAVEVLVTEGRVSVNQAVAPLPSTMKSPLSPAVAPVPTPLAVLDVNRRIVVDLNPQLAGRPQTTVVEPDEIDERLAWRAPRMEFTRATLAEAVAVLNGYSAGRRSAGQSGVQFIIEDPTLGDIRVSGLFRVDKVDAFVGLLMNGFGIEAERRGDNQIVLRRAK
jgi:transmembrane sensor